MKKKLIALLLSCAMLTGILSGVASFAEEADLTGGYEETLETSDEKIEDDIQIAEIVDDTADTATLAPSTDPTTEPTPEPDASSDDGTDGEDDGEDDFDGEVFEVVEESEDEPVLSEIVYEEEPIVNMTDVAPFLDPVIGDYSGDYDLFEMSKPNLMAMDSMIAAYEGETEEPTIENESGLELEKTVTEKDGSYTIRLEAYAPGSQEITTITKEIPTDFILVLDQSGSMADDMGTVGYNQYTEYNKTNSNLFNKRHNGGSSNLWYEVDGKYYSVSVAKKEVANYTALSGNLVNYDSSWSMGGEIISTNCYWKYKDELYEKVGSEYTRVELKREYSYSDWSYTYTYTFSNGTPVTSQGSNTTPNLGTHAPLYYKTVDTTKTEYTYSYTDDNDNIQVIDTSTGDANSPDKTFYSRTTSTSGGGSRLSALKSAVQTFADSVAEKAAGKDGDINNTDDNVNHRIAVVGFASQSGYGDNTELLSIAGRNSGTVGIAYNSSISDKNYKDVLQNMDESAGQTMVNNAINALAAKGATRTDLGLEMAEGILDANPVLEGEKRNRVVIVFTDGAPTSFDGFNKEVANNAIDKAETIKTDLGATVYTIGIFSGADANSAGTEPRDNLNQNSNQMSPACNWFMQKLSSNDGTPQTPSYYLSAGDADALNNIFETISNQETTDNVLTKLDEKSVIADIVTPYFTMPSDVNEITVYTADYTGKNGDKMTFDKDELYNGADIYIDETTRTVKVSNFNFKENWCGTINKTGETPELHGKKLIIEFTVTPAPGFLGGNGVPTNEGAYVYENENSNVPCGEFEPPKGVDVKIPDVEIGLKENYTYLGAYMGNTVTEAELINETTIRYKGTDGKDYYIIRDNGTWKSQLPNMSDYVKITVDLNLSDDDKAKLDSVMDDMDIPVKVTITPKYDGEMQSKEKIGNHKLNVFKPEVTYKDSEINLGDAANYADNYGGVVWKHKKGDEEVINTSVTNAKIFGDAPTLTYEYDPVAGAFTSDTFVAVNSVTLTYSGTGEQTTKIVTINRGDTNFAHITFVHEEHKENANCQWKPDDLTTHNFIVHVKSFDLTITKTITKGEENQSFLFTITGPNNFSMEVVIADVVKAPGQTKSVTIKNLPAGEYTVTEETSWSWRYECTDAAERKITATDVKNGVAVVTFQNTLKKTNWIDGNTYCKNKWNDDTITPQKN